MTGAASEMEAAVPAELQALRQWVCWRLDLRRNTKVPCNALHGGLASSTNPDTWCSFQEALGAASYFDGIGFVFTKEDPYCGIDLDDCVDESGDWLWGEDLAQWLDTYSEVSPSGRGVKLIVRAAKPAGTPCSQPDLGIEIYDHSRFFTITGSQIAGLARPICDGQEKIDALCSYLFPPSRPLQLTHRPTADETERERRALGYLAAMPPALSGSGGHNATFAAATALVHGFEIAPERALQMLGEHYNPRCEPPWSAKELEHKVHQAATKEHSRPRGWLMGTELVPTAPSVDLSGIIGGVPSDEQLFTFITSRELDGADYELSYLVDGILTRGQPAIIAGPKKSLKTNISIDLAMSLSTGGLFLGRFSAPMAVRVGVMSGESGGATVQETARRIARAKGATLPEFDNVFWSFDVPQLASQRHVRAVEMFVRANALDVLILDPTYLMMLGIGNDAGNLFAVGSLLKSIGDLARDTGCTPILCHHLRKGITDPFEPAELDNIAWAGFQEFTRQWILINRRERYQPEHEGSHKLWMSAGGSAGHSGLWGIDIEEGSREDTGGRRWDVDILTAAEACEAQSVTREIVGEEKRRMKREFQFEKDRESLLQVLRERPNGETLRELQRKSGIRGSRATDLLEELVAKGFLIATELRKNTRMERAFRLNIQNDAQSNFCKAGAGISSTSEGRCQ